MAPRLVIHAVAAFSKAMLSLGCRDVQVNGLDHFLQVLSDQTRKREQRGILTYCNHISVMDEPTIWGSLPWWTFRSPSTTRWTLGASDIMFTNRLLTRFFTAGQVISTTRGGGIFQPSIDTSIAKLDHGDWIHIFPEGFVNVGTTSLPRRFKWGIGRMIMEAQRDPVVIPIWITGFDRIMPEPRASPKFLPRLGASVSITFGTPLDPSLLRRAASSPPAPAHQVRAIPCSAYPHLVPDSPGHVALHTLETDEQATRRSALSAVLRDEMRSLARQVRRRNGRDERKEEALCHTATLVGTVGQAAGEPERSERGVREAVQREVRRRLGKEVGRKEAEEGWKDGPT